MSQGRAQGVEQQRPDDGLRGQGAGQGQHVADGAGHRVRCRRFRQGETGQGGAGVHLDTGHRALGPDPAAGVDEDGLPVDLGPTKMGVEGGPLGAAHHLDGGAAMILGGLAGIDQGTAAPVFTDPVQAGELLGRHQGTGQGLAGPQPTLDFEQEPGFQPVGPLHLPSDSGGEVGYRDGVNRIALFHLPVQAPGDDAVRADHCAIEGVFFLGAGAVGANWACRLDLLLDDLHPPAQRQIVEIRRALGLVRSEIRHRQVAADGPGGFLGLGLAVAEISQNDDGRFGVALAHGPGHRLQVAAAQGGHSGPAGGLDGGKHGGHALADQ